MPWTAGSPPTSAAPVAPAADKPWYLRAVDDTIREWGVWLIIILVAIVGLWGLLAPGGGVAIVERAAR